MPNASPVMLDSARPRGGRRFEPVQELDLLGDGLMAASKLPSAYRGLTVIGELAGPYGVPDLVACVGTPNRLADRRAAGVRPILNEADAIIAAAASSVRGLRPDKLASQLGWEEAFVQQRVTGLARCGALVLVSDGYRRARGVGPLGRVYAIETKLKDWKRAVRQGRSYRVWSDAYIVVMGSLGTTALDRVTDAVRSDGGGLMVAGDWVLRPRIGPLPAGRRLWGSEFVYAALGEDG